MRTSFKNLPLALELSAESLPLFIANIPDFKSILRNPVAIFYQVISHADMRLAEIKKKNGSARGIFLIKGSLGEGKTTFVKQVIEILKNKNIHVGGILSERVMADHGTIGYDLVNIETGERENFLRQNGDCGNEKIGRFTISNGGLALGNEVLNSVILVKNLIVSIDEVGLLELENRGWAGALAKLLERSHNHLLITVRDIYIKDIIAKWDLADATIFEISNINPFTAAEAIIEYIRQD